ncbi:MAG: endopeptidase La [Acidobacteria bacterium]|nr:endopeptidase La [Acidobacteriota bacterium]
MGTDKVQILPILPLKSAVLFPGLLMPLSVGRDASIKAVEAALKTEEKEILVVAQRSPETDEPGQDDLYTIGTKATIRKISRPNSELIELLVMGTERVVITRVSREEGLLRAKVRPLPAPQDRGTEVEALQGALFELAMKAIALAQSAQTPAEVSQMLQGGSSEEPVRLAYLLASMFSIDVAKEQALLESETTVDALRLMHKYLSHEVQVLEIRARINTEARSEINKDQREYMLRQQMRAIQQELGEKGSDQDEIQQLREKLEKADLPEEVAKEAKRELSRLERLPSAQPEYQVIRTYLEYVLELPWKTTTEDNLSISNARTILDEDHFGLKEVKERILEQLAVLKMNPSAKAPILCFVGPPGVGKTSLGQSIARALGRKFERMSLGGMHDESELRGHRRTYIGAMPGRLVTAMRRAGSKNPVLLLDEIDKLGRDFRGDPAAALLEVLDPEQNKTFRDNYLDLPFDLSQALFITTANTLDTIPRPLLDRMEILRLSGYAEEEKLDIAKRYIVPKKMADVGLTAEQVKLSDEALSAVIKGYTREAGLRRLEQAVGRLLRKVALLFAEGRTEVAEVTPEMVSELLGPEPFQQETMRRRMPAGVAAGLAWTEAGGDVLYIEATRLPAGKGLTLTGQLGDVMKESAQTARSFVWSRAGALGIAPEAFKEDGVHVHVPAGAIPKDGPSAGVTMVVAMTSLHTGLPMRNDTAMTGEVTLTGLVLPIGGVKEKVLAARRAGLTRVILPAANRKDVREIPENVRKEMTFVFAERIEEVLEAAIPALQHSLTLETAAA